MVVVVGCWEGVVVWVKGEGEDWEAGGEDAYTNCIHVYIINTILVFKLVQQLENPTRFESHNSHHCIENII